MAAAAAALLVIATTVSAGVTTADAGDSDWLVGVKDSSVIDGPAVFDGRVRDASGHPVAGRATLIAWPANPDLARAQDGDHIKLMPVGKAEIGADGDVVMKVDPDAMLADYTSPDGIVNFDLVVNAPEGGAVFSFGRRVSGRNDKPEWLGSLEPLEPAGATAATADLVLNPQMKAVSGGASDKTCQTRVVGTYDLRETIVGETYTGPSAKAQVKYMIGSDSELGVGVSITGTKGSWTASGTALWSSTDVETFPWQLQNSSRTMRTYYGYKNYLTECWDSGYYSTTYSFRPYANQGGQITYTDTAPSATLCVPYGAGGGRTRTSGTGYKFSTGVKVGSLLGIDLSAKTAYSTSTTTEYSFISAGQLCGTDAYPGTAQRLVAKGP